MLALNEINCSEIKPGNAYIIKEIYPCCEWYPHRKEFIGKRMRCVEDFEGEPARGFQFVDPADCPDAYCADRAFCFTRVKVIEGNE